MNTETIDELLEVVQMRPDHATLFRLSLKSLTNVKFQGFIHAFYDHEKKIINKVSLGLDDEGIHLLSAIQTMLAKGSLFNGYTQFKSFNVDSIAAEVDLTEESFHPKHKWFYFISFNNIPNDRDIFIAIFEDSLDYSSEISIRLIAHLSRILRNKIVTEELIKEIKNQGSTSTIASTIMLSEFSEIDTKIAEMICQGFTNQQIADAMNYSLPSVRQRASSIYRLLGVKNRAQAVFQLSKLVSDQSS